MIKIYSTTSCPYCQLAKTFFKERKIDFTEINVEVDEMAAKEMIEKTGQSGVPVIDIDGYLIVGFNRPEIERVLSQKAK